MSLASLGSARSLDLQRRNGINDAACIGATDWNALDADHPLRLADRVVRELLRERQDMPAKAGPPDRHRLIRSLLLQVLYAIDCDARLLEQLRYDLRFRWFAGLGIGEPVWLQAAHVSARDALLQRGPERQLLDDLLRGLRPIAMIWPECFGFDESLVECWQQNAVKPASAVEPAQLRQQALLLQAAGIADGAAQVDSRLLRVLEWILTRICEPDLNCDVLAAGVGMSRRALYYLFDGYALTPTVAIRNIRLEHCKRLLEDARHSRRKITAIALDHGFSNIYSFSRSFKQRYGIGPRDCRIVGMHSACAATA